MRANECYLIPHTVCKSPEADEIVATPTQSTMTFEQAATLKQLAEAAYELDAFKPRNSPNNGRARNPEGIIVGRANKALRQIKQRNGGR